MYLILKLFSSGFSRLENFNNSCPDLPNLAAQAKNLGSNRRLNIARLQTIISKFLEIVCLND